MLTIKVNDVVCTAKEFFVPNISPFRSEMAKRWKLEGDFKNFSNKGGSLVLTLWRSGHYSIDGALVIVQGLV